MKYSPRASIDAVVVFPFDIPIIPYFIHNAFHSLFASLRIIQPKSKQSKELERPGSDARKAITFPFNFVTAPLVAVLFLLACKIIGRKEVHDGIIGTDG